MTASSSFPTRIIMSATVVATGSRLASSSCLSSSATRGVSPAMPQAHASVATAAARWSYGIARLYAQADDDAGAAAAMQRAIDAAEREGNSRLVPDIRE